MALFSRQPKKETGLVPATSSTTPKASGAPRDISHILRNPRITEKGTLVQSMSVYVFDVAKEATKNDIAKAVQHFYKARPRQVRIVNIPDRAMRNMRTGKRGVRRGGKKAYVYLKKGETINLT